MSGAGNVVETAVIEYRVCPGGGDEPAGDWKHGRAIQGWVAEDADALREQRAVVRAAVREWGDAGRGDTVMTRVVAYDADGNVVKAACR